MKVAENLRIELQRIAPDWDWRCEETRMDSPDLFSAKTLQISGENKSTHTQTIPIHVSAYPNAKIPQLATFICEVLMISSARSEAQKTLLLQG
jgi:hypothetical protein